MNVMIKRELERRADQYAHMAHSLAARGLQVRCCDLCDEDGCCVAGCAPVVEYSPASNVWLVERELKNVSPEVRALTGIATSEGRRRIGSLFAQSGKGILLRPETDARDESTEMFMRRLDEYCEALLDAGVPPRRVVSMFCVNEAQRSERTVDGRKRASNAMYSRARNNLKKQGRWYYQRRQNLQAESPM